MKNLTTKQLLKIILFLSVESNKKLDEMEETSAWAHILSVLRNFSLMYTLLRTILKACGKDILP